MKFTIIPYILVNFVIILELGAIIYMMTKNNTMNIPKVKREKKKNNRKQETFNGFYVDR